MTVLKSLFSIRLLLLLDNIGWNDNDNSIIIIPAYIIPSVGHKPPFKGEEETCTVGPRMRLAILELNRYR